MATVQELSAPREEILLRMGEAAGRDDYQGVLDAFGGELFPEAAVNLYIAYKKLNDLAGARTVADQFTRFVKVGEPLANHLYGMAADMARENRANLSFRLYQIALDSFVVPNDILFLAFEQAKRSRNYNAAEMIGLTALSRAENDTERSSAHSLLGGFYKDTAVPDRALAHFETAAMLGKTTTSHMTNWIMTAHYTDSVTWDTNRNMMNEFDYRYCRGLPRFDHQLDPARVKDGLHIGFIGGDFCHHSLANLIIEPMAELAKLNRVTIYNSRIALDSETTDPTGERFKNAVSGWRAVGKRSNRETAELIRKDRVDVLVDLAGPTALHRLEVFGRNPAPVQVGWISGMMTPPGVDAIRYFITDQYCAGLNPRTDANLLYLSSAYCFKPLDNEDAPIADPPFIKNGFITFGSNNNVCKLNRTQLKVWANILKRVPDSILVLRAETPYIESNIRRLFGDNVDQRRVKFFYQPVHTEVLPTISRTYDIYLDTWPCAGCLTTAENMWAGCVPVVVQGDTWVSRQSSTLLHQVGLSNLLADTFEQYEDVAVGLAQDREQIRSIRAGLRAAMKGAPLCNYRGIALELKGAFETAYLDSVRRLA